jgi:hypothetical protein
MGKAKKIEKLKDLTPDPRNANLGTEEGLRLIEDSFRQNGAGRSILVDRNGVTIAGAKSLGVAADIGLEIEVVHSDGKKLIVVQRDDLDLEKDPEARRLAYMDNRASEKSLNWDAGRIAEDAAAGFDFSGIFPDWELEKYTNGPTVDPSKPDPGDPAGLGAMEPTCAYNIVFDDEPQLNAFYAFLKALKKSRPDLPTIGARIMAFIADNPLPGASE